MRPLLRCHLEIPKNCQISHGRRRLTEIRAVTWWRRQNSSANRQTKPGGGGIWLAKKHLIIIFLIPLILIFQKAIGSCQSTFCHLIVQVRVGRPWRKLSQSGRRLFTRLFGRSAVLLSSQGVRWTRWVAWPWTWLPCWAFSFVLAMRFGSWLQPYLIFVIFFTQAKFLENKICTEKTRKLRQNTQKVANFLRYYGKIHSKLPIFRVKSVKIYTCQKKFTRACSWRSWQISGMD